MSLTKKQRKVFDFIRDSIHEYGICPSYQEIADRFDLKSKSGVHRLIIALEERGFVTRRPAGARTLQIAGDPGNPEKFPCPHCGKPIFTGKSS